jgi:hypothetical protein
MDRKIKGRGKRKLSRKKLKLKEKKLKLKKMRRCMTEEVKLELTTQSNGRTLRLPRLEKQPVPRSWRSRNVVRRKRSSTRLKQKQ